MTEVTLSQALNSLAKGINAQIENHASLFQEAENRHVDEFNELFDRYEELELQHDTNVAICRETVKERDLLLKKRKSDELDVKQIVVMSRKLQDRNNIVNDENNRIMKEIKELRALNPKKMKEQIIRLKDQNKAHKLTIESLRKNRGKSDIEDMSNHSKKFTWGDAEFYAHKRMVTGKYINTIPSNHTLVQTPFFYIITTNFGVTFDIIMTKRENGDLGIFFWDHFLNIELPPEMLDYVAAEYKEVFEPALINEEFEGDLDSLLEKFEG